jgi:hypothetical protein
LIVSVEVYLIIQTINDYMKYNGMMWPDGTKPDAELNATIVFAVFSLVCLPFFVIACVFKVGNFANDGVQLGKDPIKEIFRKKHFRGRAWKVWRNFCPTAQTVHVMSAFLLLLPKPLLEGRIIKGGVLTKGMYSVHPLGPPPPPFSNFISRIFCVFSSGMRFDSGQPSGSQCCLHHFSRICIEMIKICKLGRYSALLKVVRDATNTFYC